MRKKDKPWSKKSPSCIRCGTTEVKHIARGLCLNCYRLYNEKNQKSHIREYPLWEITKEYLEKEYLENQKSLSDISKELCCTRQYIHKLIKRYNIPLRTKKIARDLALEKGKLRFQRTGKDGTESSITLKKVEYDHSFFKYWSSEMAWVLGVIYSDGNIYINKNNNEDKRLSISQKESELLEKVKAVIKCNVDLYYTKKRVLNGIVAGDLYHLNILDTQLVNDLLGLGVTPNKSLDVRFPMMPNEYVRHFIRGCWDGDGSIFVERERQKIVASYVSGSLNFIQGMLSELEKAGFERRKIYILKRGKNPSYSFKFHSSQCEKLYHYFYDDVLPSQYLERKYMVFKKHFVD